MPPYDKYDPKLDAYAGPRPEDIWDHRDKIRAWDQQQRREAEYRDKVGRVISQEGLEGALVVAWKQEGWETAVVGVFKICLKDGTIVEGTWDRSYKFQTKDDPAGVSSNGWTVGEIEPFHGDEVPF